MTDRRITVPLEPVPATDRAPRPPRYALRIRPLLTAAALLVLLGAGASSAQAYTTGAEVMHAVDARPSPATAESTLTMTITTGGGQSLTRTMTMWSANDDRLIKFTAPANIAGSGFLIVTHPDGSDETMVYLPALGRVRRIAAGQQSDSFFGSDFAYEDITGIPFDDYQWQLQSVGDGPTYVVQGTLKPGRTSSYDQLVLDVPQSTLIPTRIAYYSHGESGQGPHRLRRPEGRRLPDRGQAADGVHDRRLRGRQHGHRAIRRQARRDDTARGLLRAVPEALTCVPFVGCFSCSRSRADRRSAGPR